MNDIHQVIANFILNTENDNRIIHPVLVENILTYLYPGYNHDNWHDFSLNPDITHQGMLNITQQNVHVEYPENLFIAMANVIRLILMFYIRGYIQNQETPPLDNQDALLHIFITNHINNDNIDDDTIIEGIEPLLQIIDTYIETFPGNDEDYFVFFLAWYNMLITLIEHINGPEEIIQHPSLDNSNTIMTRRQRRERLCCICHEDFVEEGGVVTPCNHYYHQNCLQELACYNNTGETVPCPMCRATLQRGPRFGNIPDYYW